MNKTNKVTNTARTAKIGDNTGMSKLNVQMGEVANHELKKIGQQLKLIDTLYSMGDIIPFKYLSTGNATVSIDTAINEWLNKEVAEFRTSFADKDLPAKESMNDAALTRLALDKQAAAKRCAAMRRMFRDSVQIVYMLHHIEAEQLSIDGAGHRQSLSYTARETVDWKVTPKSSERVTGMSVNKLQSNASAFIAKMAGSANEATKSAKRKAALAAKKLAKQQAAEKRNSGAGATVINTMGTLAAELAKPMPEAARTNIIGSPAFDADLVALIDIKFVSHGPTLANVKRKFDLAALVAWVKATFKDVDIIEPVAAVTPIVKATDILMDGKTAKPQSAASAIAPVKRTGTRK